MGKRIPAIGEELYLRQSTGSYYVDMVKRPYTVIAVTGSEVTVQAAKLVYPVFHYRPGMSEYYKQFDGKRVGFYDTVAESIEPDPHGSTETLTWHSRKGMWGTKGLRDSDYPQYAVFGKYEHQPYLD